MQENKSYAYSGRLLLPSGSGSDPGFPKSVCEPGGEAGEGESHQISQFPIVNTNKCTTSEGMVEEERRSSASPSTAP